MPPSSMNASTSLQIPSLDSPAGSSSRQHYPSPPSTNMSATSRPVSVAVHPTPTSPSPASAASRRQQRASHTVVSSQQSHQNQTNHGHHPDDVSAYTDVYLHPAAAAYSAAHPRRTIPKFGPYLLLQTLGEGEFGKVKLGLHSQWGEEVAVKLIRRGNVDNTVRMSKVEREIEVLRTLKHPNIVRLYDVIETDKYIGIILEYASGGELFDHILAHRYLREKDAAKLFSQLISGVWYIHQKKIVHRDLKLENLLLDRHRNVIITDFGFANRFEHRSDDLMQTSCGSPCYAAPELVISEGLYVGSAVDIWSCGVILYAMLAGYLPFDDDPANPDGDNINLLYKYIVNTPLSFPEYISAEARDLLGMMLVPDPTRRASLEDVMRHPWLGAYAGEPGSGRVPTAFGKSVNELEGAAMEQHQQKRLAYQKQMKAAAAALAASTASSVGPSPNTKVTRTQSHRPDPVPSTANSPSGIVPPSGTRSRSTQPQPSAQPEYTYYETSIDQSYASTPGTTVAASVKKSYGSPGPAMDDDDPFAAPGGAVHVPTINTNVAPVSKGRPSEDNGSSRVDSSEKRHKTTNSGGAGGFRHTIQVEYDEPQKGKASSSVHRASEDRERRSRDRPSQPPSQVQSTQNGTTSKEAAPVAPTHARKPSHASESTKPLPPSPPPQETQTPVKPSAPVSPQIPSNMTTPTKANFPPSSPITSSAIPVPETPILQVNAASPPLTPITFSNPDEKEKERETSSQNSSTKGHRKGRSSVDKLGLGKIFGTASPGSPVVENGNVSANGSMYSGGSSVLLSPGLDREKEKEREKAEKEKKNRRNTFNVMVEPFSRSIRNRGAKGRMASSPMAGNPEKEREVMEPPPQSAPSASEVSSGLEGGVASTFVNLSRTDIPSEAGAGVGMQASSSKARKVMEWFRTKNKGGRDSIGIGGMFEEAEYKRENAVSSGAVNHHVRDSSSGSNGAPMSPVQVVITTPPAGIPKATPSVNTNTAHPQRTPSSTTDTSFATPSLVTRFRNSVTVGGSSSGGGSSSSKTHNQGPGGTLRIHHGAVDQTTITTRPPPEVIKHVREVLEGMGVEIQVESEYKFRCIRPKKRKGGAGAGVGLVTAGAGGSVAAFTMVGSAASNGVDKRGLPVPSQSTFSSTGGMLRGLLMRRQSSQVSAGGLGSSQHSQVAFDDETPVTNEPSSMMPENTTYGDLTQDAGDEIRFYVELTRLDRLNDTYSLDIRRLKGNLRSYKFLYDTLRQRADLQR